MAVVFVTISLADTPHWASLNQRAREFGAYAAVLQGEGPGLVGQLDELAALGHTDITLVGVTFGETGVPTSWIGHVARWWRATKNQQAQVRLVPGAVRGLPDTLPTNTGRNLRADENVLSNSTWERVIEISHQILVCRGPRCTAKGAEAILAALGSELYQRGMLEHDILVTQTGCLYPCNRAPVVAVQPDMTWFGPLTPEAIKDFADHLVRLCTEALGRVAQTLQPPGPGTA